MNEPSSDYIKLICELYADTYDDREEDSKPGGWDWEPGVPAGHKSLNAFQRELRELHGISLSRTKMQKILITGGCWTTERSREVQEMYAEHIRPAEGGGGGMKPAAAVRAIAEELQISAVSVAINLPYEKTVYALDDKSANARRIDKCRERKRKMEAEMTDKIQGTERNSGDGV